MMTDDIEAIRKFDLGQIVTTRRVADTIRKDTKGRAWLGHVLGRHASGDWGDLDPLDRAVNDQVVADGGVTLANGLRIHSSYRVPPHLRDLGGDENVWVITAVEPWGHKQVIVATTFLFPSDY